MNKFNAKIRLSLLETYFKAFSVNHEKMIAFAPDHTHDYFKTHLADLVEDSYCDKYGQFLQFIEEAEKQSLGNEQQQAPANPNSFEGALNKFALSNAQNLPKVSIPSFPGNLSE